MRVIIMHSTVEEFVTEMAATHDFSVEPELFPEGTKTAADAASAVGCHIDQIVKSLVMEAGDELVLVLTSGGNRVDEQELASMLDVDTVGSADPNRIKRELGWSIGGVPPCCHDRSIRTYYDPTLTEYDIVWAAAGTPDAVFAIAPDRLLAITDAEPTDAFT